MSELKFLKRVGISRLGKWLIEEHGRDGQIIEHGTFEGDPAWRLCSLWKTEGMEGSKDFERLWVRKNGDRHFEVVT